MFVEAGQQVDSGQAAGTNRVSVTGDRPVRIANCSGFFGDRLSAAKEMVDGGDIDVLTGDWLAELTMLILHKQRARNGELGYASTFLTQMEQVLAPCVERGIKVVTNAGGLNPAGCADRVRQIAERLGISVAVAHIEGDDLMPRIDGLRPQLANLDTGAAVHGHAGHSQRLPRRVGHRRRARRRGRCRDLPAGHRCLARRRPRSLVVALAERRLERLAGAVVAGHVIECGAQTTGGNYSFFEEIPDPSEPPGFPIAEVDSDGSSVITKHPGTGGLVSVGTVTAQLLYEIGGAHYPNPDVVADFSTIQLAGNGPDRVRIHGVRGIGCPSDDQGVDQLRRRLPQPHDLRAHRSSPAARRPQWAESALFARLGGKERFDEVDVQFTPAPSDAIGQEASSGRLHVTVKSSDERVVGRAFSSAVIELALANYPGFFVSSQPAEAQAVRRVLAGVRGQRRGSPGGRAERRSTARHRPTAPASGRRSGDAGIDDPSMPPPPDRSPVSHSAACFGARSVTRVATPTSACGHVTPRGYAWLARTSRPTPSVA